jgi:hypothetical protein
VLLAIDDAMLCARLAYELTAHGFEVGGAPPIGDGNTARPPEVDVIVAGLLSTSEIDRAAEPWCTNPRTSGVPLVAVAREASAPTCEFARRLGCAALFVNTCDGLTLALGLRAVLWRLCDTAQGSSGG